MRITLNGDVNECKINLVVWDAITYIIFNETIYIVYDMSYMFWDNTLCEISCMLWDTG